MSIVWVSTDNRSFLVAQPDAPIRRFSAGSSSPTIAANPNGGNYTGWVYLTADTGYVWSVFNGVNGDFLIMKTDTSTTNLDQVVLNSQSGLTNLLTHD